MKRMVIPQARALSKRRIKHTKGPRRKRIAALKIIGKVANATLPMAVKKVAAPHFLRLTRPRLRLWRGQRDARGKACHARLFALTAQIASGG